MCGRTVVSLAPDDIARACRLKGRDDRRIKPRWREPGSGGADSWSRTREAPSVDGIGTTVYKRSYNVPPGSMTPVLVAADHINICLSQDMNEPRNESEAGALDVLIEPMRWGLVPSWHRADPKEFTFKTSNCRSDSMMKKAVFKQPLDKGRRCVAICDGFYEWKTTEPNTKTKQPYFFYFGDTATQSHDVKTEEKDDQDDWKGRRLLTIAAVFDVAKHLESEEPLYSYSVITVDAAPDVAGIHHRMPAILDGDDEVIAWLDHGTIPLQEALTLIKPKSCLRYHAVSTLVNKSTNNSPDLIQLIDVTKKSASAGLMSSWLKKKGDPDKPDKPESPDTKRRKREQSDT